jgi:hypothetical protein
MGMSYQTVLASASADELRYSDLQLDAYAIAVGADRTAVIPRRMTAVMSIQSILSTASA